jgi:chemotaxis protein MotB
MAGDAKKLQPIIIKKVKKGGHGAHGGAWKIAYADFVTAMMAFFLLMWLLGSTSEGDKKGIADYFQSPLKVALLNGGSGSGDASSVIKGGGQDLSRSAGQVKRGDVKADRSTINLQALKAEQRRAEEQQLGELGEQMGQALASDPRLGEMRDQIKLSMTPDGLRIQIVDAQNRPMFASGSSVVAPHMRELLQAIGSVLGEVPNRVAIEGHTDATPFPNSAAGYTNWELSADRANASRRELVAGGLDPDSVVRVLGMAASQPYNREDPLDPQNRRISILVMNRDAERRFLDPGLAVPVVDELSNAPRGRVPPSGAIPAPIPPIDTGGQGGDVPFTIPLR